MSIVGFIGHGVSGNESYYWENYSSVPIKLEFDAHGINNLGNIVGNFDSKPAYLPNKSSTPIYLNMGSGTIGNATGINNLGNIVGYIDNKAIYWPDKSSPPIYLIDNGASGSANGINDLGNIVGNIGGKPVYWPDNSSPPIYLIDNGLDGSANGINNLGNIVGYIKEQETQGVEPPSYITYWENYLSVPIYLNTLNINAGHARSINDNKSISNICFPAGTPIKTDQGFIPIELLDKQIHTVGNKTILHITQTITLDKYLISFDKHSLERNVPDKKTIMTKEHKIEFKGQMVSAYRFLDYSDKVKKVKYNGETLYNVLLAEHSTMNVNNIICETLHPDNIIAKLYTNNYTSDDRQNIIYKMNSSLTNNDLSTYKNVVKQLSYTR